MAETYSAIYPGNWVNHPNTWGRPNAAFKTAKRASGDPLDRQHQAVVVRPGVLAVQKVGYLHIEGAVPAGTAVQGYDLKIASPDARADDKPRADITSLVVPTGAQLYRVGLRLPRLGEMPGYYSSGAKDPVNPERSGIKTNTSGAIWLEAKAAAPAAKPAGGAITATGANTPALTVNATTGDFDAAAVQFSLATPVVTTADLTLKVWADKGGFGSDFRGGCYVVAEVCYLIDAPVADLSWIPALEGARVAGYTG
jgi:hypothetical protein